MHGQGVGTQQKRALLQDHITLIKAGFVHVIHLHTVGVHIHRFAAICLFSEGALRDQYAGQCDAGGHGESSPQITK
jgi:hypothetical protein